MNSKTMIMRTFFIAVYFLLNYSFLKSQNVGIGNTDPKAKLDISGDLILKSADLTLSDGNTLDLDVNINKYNHYKLLGPTGNFQIGGITAAEHDRIITLYNRAGHSLEVYNDDVTAIDSNRILTGTGGTFAVYPGGSVTLKYDNTINKWEITASHYNSLDNFGSGNWSLSGNDIYNANVGNVGINTTTPLTSLQVNGNLSLVSDTVLTLCSTIIPPSVNNRLLIDNITKKRSIFHIMENTSCQFTMSPLLLGLKGGTDGHIVTIFMHMNNSQVLHMSSISAVPTAADSLNMIELFEPNNNGNINQPTQLSFNTGGAITLIYDGIRNKWKPINYYGDVKSDLTAWYKGPNPNDIYNPNSGNVGIGTGLPSEKLDVYGNAKVRDKLIVEDSLGIGTNTPTEKLELIGSAKISNNLSLMGSLGIGTNFPNYPFHLKADGIGISQSSLLGASKIGFYTNSSAAYIQTHTNTDLSFATNNGSTQMKLQTNGNFGIGDNFPNATLSVVRGFGTDGTAAFFGSTHTSHFNYSTNEDTYIRGGKNGSKIYLNDHGGPIGIGTTNTGAAQVHILSSRTGANANGLSITQNITNSGNDSYGLYSYANGGGVNNFGIAAEAGTSGNYNNAGEFRADGITTGVNKGIHSHATGSTTSNMAGHFFAENVAGTETYGVRAVATGNNSYPYIQAGLFAKGINCHAGLFEGNVDISSGWLYVTGGHISTNLDVFCSELHESSDENLKRNITPISSSIQNILKVTPVNYYWKKENDDNKIQTGLIAQELQKIYPELVSTDKDGNLAVRYTGLIPYLIKGMQEQQSEIDEFKEENRLLIIKLQNEIIELKKLVSK